MDSPPASNKRRSQSKRAKCTRARGFFCLSQADTSVIFVFLALRLQRPITVVVGGGRPPPIFALQLRAQEQCHGSTWRDAHILMRLPRAASL